MLKLYFHATPNSMKVELLLQELALEHELIPIDIFTGAQHAPEYRQVNPNAKVPAIVDDDGVTVFDSHAILLHLAMEHGRFLPSDKAGRAAALSWLEFVATGLSPFSGQAVHFLYFAPDTPYAKNRYVKEVERHYRVLDERLSVATYLAGAEYSIADMALWGWATLAGFVFGDKGLMDYPHVKRFMDDMAKRPAAARALEVKERHTFKSEVDAETRRALFPQNEE